MAPPFLTPGTHEIDTLMSDRLRRRRDRDRGGQRRPVLRPRRYRSERGAEPRQVSGGRGSSFGSEPCSGSSPRCSSSSASSSPTRRARSPTTAPTASRSPPEAAEDRSDRPAVAVALRLPERSLLLLQAGRPGRHRGRTRPRLDRRRPHLGRAGTGGQARRRSRQAQPGRLPRRRGRRLRRPVGDPLRPGLRGDADRGRSRLTGGYEASSSSQKGDIRPPRTGSSA